MTGLTRLTSRPGLALGVVAAGLCFTALGPLLRLMAGLAPDPAWDQVLHGAASLPMGLYVLPRLQAHLDASTAGRSENPESAWQRTFEQRWWRYTLSSFLLSLLLVAGFLACIVPMFAVLAAFGFAPLRSLVLGEGVLEGFRGCARMMARGWPRAVWVAGSAMLLALALLVPLAALPKDPQEALGTLQSPWFWIRGLASSGVSVWLSSTFLALFQALEADQASATPSASSDGK